MEKAKIKMLVMDVDGTLTDGKVYIGKQGEIFKSFSVKDGCGIKDILPALNILPVILTGRKSEIVEHRSAELNIANVYQGCRDKAAKLIEIAESYHFSLKNGVYTEIAYIGDDILDLEAMRMCSVRACPQDAVEEIKGIANFICNCRAGDGAVRELIEYLKNS